MVDDMEKEGNYILNRKSLAFVHYHSVCALSELISLLAAHVIGRLVGGRISRKRFKHLP